MRFQYKWIYRLEEWWYIRGRRMLRRIWNIIPIEIRMDGSFHADSDGYTRVPYGLQLTLNLYLMYFTAHIVIPPPIRRIMTKWASQYRLDASKFCHNKAVLTHRCVKTVFEYPHDSNVEVKIIITECNKCMEITASEVFRRAMFTCCEMRLIRDSIIDDLADSVADNYICKRYPRAT